MKKFLLLAGCLLGASVLLVQFTCLAESSASRTVKAKEAVSKVLAEHEFTPPVVLPSTNSAIWLVSSRAPGANTVEQAVVAVPSAGEISVQLMVYRRELDKWKSSSPTNLVSLQRKLEQQIRTELASPSK